MGIGGASTFTSGTNIEVADANVARLGFTNTSTNGSQWAWFAGTAGQAGLYDYDNSRQVITADSSGNVGIGTTSPIDNLNIYDSDNNVGLVLQTATTGTTGGDGFRVGINNAEAFLWQYESLPLTFATSGSERMRIDSSGNLLVGQSSTALPGAGNSTTGISISGQYDAIFLSRDSGQPLVANRNSDGDVIEIRKSGATVGSIGTIDSGGSQLTIANTGTGLCFRDNQSAILPASSSSLKDNAINLGNSSFRFNDIYLSGGVYLGGTGAANKLDDYEEGTWTPQVYYQNATDQGNVTYGIQAGTYTRIGQQVTVSFRLEWTAGSAANDNIGVQNLPFTGADNHYGAGGVLLATASIASMILRAPLNGSPISLVMSSTGASNLGDDFGTGAQYIRGTITYRTNS